MTTADAPRQTDTPARPINKTAVAANLLLVATWLWLFRGLGGYLAIIFTREDFRTNQIVLLLVLLLIGNQLWQEKVSVPLDQLPYPHRLPLILTLTSAILYLLAARFLDINTLASVLFGLGSYGLTGLWLSPARWRQGLPAALLLIGTLPFGAHMQTFIGYPMRIFTAQLVQQALAALGVGSVGVDTILVFENGISHVDLPCSGVQSLWTGMLFLTAATWVEKRPLNKRWLLVALAFSLSLFLANLGRVAILVTVGQVLNAPLLAEMLHVPLGVMGFIMACAAALILLRLAQTEPAAPPPTPARLARHAGPSIASRRFLSRFLPTLTLVFFLLGLLYGQRPSTGLTQAAPAWRFPNALRVTPLPLKPDENAWLTRDGAEAAERFRFEWGDVSGSMILITSQTWRAHHRPERCFEVYGLKLEESRTHLVSTDFPLRLVSLGQGEQHHLYSATYWFQSAHQTTDDYGTRIWSDVSLNRDRWVLVSILFEGSVNPDDDDIAALYQALHRAAAIHLTGE